jgi:hypothetical protein
MRGHDVTPVIPATGGTINRRITVQGDLGIKRDPISKITNPKRSVEWFREYRDCLASTRP